MKTLTHSSQQLSEGFAQWCRILREGVQAFYRGLCGAAQCYHKANDELKADMLASDAARFLRDLYGNKLAEILTRVATKQLAPAMVLLPDIPAKRFIEHMPYEKQAELAADGGAAEVEVYDPLRKTVVKKPVREISTSACEVVFSGTEVRPVAEQRTEYLRREEARFEVAKKYAVRVPDSTVEYDPMTDGVKLYVCGRWCELTKRQIDTAAKIWRAGHDKARGVR